jgi:cell division protein FtsI (penicillin-binding protein 3)
VKDGNANKPEHKQVISESTARDVRDLLRLVVVHGTGKQANAPGYDVGGKTGTAEKNTNGVYHKDAKVASFVGVFPSSNPKYAILVMVDEPKGNKSTAGYATGGWISAPVVGRVVQRMAPLLAMKPDFNPSDARVNAYWAAAQSRTKAAQMARENHLTKEAVRAASF